MEKQKNNIRAGYQKIDRYTEECQRLRDGLAAALDGNKERWIGLPPMPPAIVEIIFTKDEEAKAKWELYKQKRLKFLSLCENGVEVWRCVKDRMEEELELIEAMQQSRSFVEVGRGLVPLNRRGDGMAQRYRLLCKEAPDQVLKRGYDAMTEIIAMGEQVRIEVEWLQRKWRESSDVPWELIFEDIAE